MSNATLDQIEQYRRWAERVRAEAQAATVPAELADTQRDLIGRAYDLETACKTPVTIGVVGEYTTGKSLLLGTLLGQPELLPVSTEATTGNVTALRLVAGPVGSATSIISASVSLLSGAQIASGAAFILTKICNMIEETGLPVDVTALKGYNPVRDGWDRFELWCRRHVWPQEAQASVPETSVLGIRDSAWELLRIRNALDRAGNLVDPVNPGAPRPLDLDEYRAGLTIADARRPPATFPTRPTTVALPAHVELTAAVLREIFPLLGRVNLSVSVPPQQWPLTGPAGVREVEFLDFPGLNARGAARDDFLSASLLRPVHTIMITVRAERPGTEVSTKFLALLAGHGRTREELADAVLVVATMVDLLTPPAVPGTALTVEKLGQTDAGFRDLSRTGYELTGQRPERVALTSLLYAIDVHRMPLRPESELTGTLTVHRPTVERRMHAWRRIGEALRAGDPSAPLAHAVAAVGEDGGIEALRSMITQHVTDHGVRLKMDALRRHSDVLHHLVTELDWKDSSDPRTVGSTAVAALFRLRDELRAAEQILADGAARLRPDTADPVWRQHLADSLHLLRLAVARYVFIWQGWDETLDAARRTGRVVLPAPTGGHPALRPDDDDDDDEREHTASAGGGEVLTNTAQLRQPFAAFLQEATKEAGRQFQRLAGLWIGETAKGLAEVWSAAGDPFDDPDRSAALAAFDPDGGARRRTWLRSYVQLQWVEKKVARQCAALNSPPELTGEQWEEAIPLLPAQHLPWAPLPAGAAGTGHDPDGHVMRLLRIRQEVADGVLRIARQRLLGALTGLSDRVHREIAEVHQEIPKNVAIERLSDDTGQPGGSGPDQPSNGGPQTGSPWRRLLRSWPPDLDPTQRKDA